MLHFFNILADATTNAATTATSAVAAANKAPLSTSLLTLFIVIIGMALIFDFLNGFHDAANSIATIVSTRVLSPTQAVLWAAFFNFIAAFIFGTNVAGTIANKLVQNTPQYMDIYVVAGGLTGAIVWNIITWLLALPTSSSHALFGGVAGAAVAKSGFSVIIFSGWVPLLLFIFLSPMIGMFLGALFMNIVAWIFRRSTPSRVDTLFRRLQLVSAGIYSLGHGGNDAQKTMGVIVLLCVTVNRPEWAQETHSFMGKTHNVQLWVIMACHFAIALGTIFGGWRIVKTMGSGITRLQPVGGFCAETAAAVTIIGATAGGIPISTTHAITGSIMGVGMTRGVRAVRWIWGQRIIVAWILTIPCSALMAAGTYKVVEWCIKPFVAS